MKRIRPDKYVIHEVLPVLEGTLHTSMQRHSPFALAFFETVSTQRAVQDIGNLVMEHITV